MGSPKGAGFGGDVSPLSSGPPALSPHMAGPSRTVTLGLVLVTSPSQPWDTKPKPISAWQPSIPLDFLFFSLNPTIWHFFVSNYWSEAL